MGKDVFVNVNFNNLRQQYYRGSRGWPVWPWHSNAKMRKNNSKSEMTIEDQEDGKFYSIWFDFFAYSNRDAGQN